MVNLTIETPEEKHLDALVELEQKSFSVPWSRDSLASLLKNPAARVFIAEEYGHVFGYIGALVASGEVYITNLAVLPGARRHGVGERLLLVLIEKMRAENAEFITLEVRRSNEAAIALYRKHGFELAGERRGYYTEPAEDALLMTRLFRRAPEARA